MAFLTFNADFSLNTSMIDEQIEDFASMTDVKRVISIGGWDFSTDPSTYQIFRDAVSTADNRATVIDNLLDFIEKYDLDGVDWDWEYPGEPDIPGIPADSDESPANFFLLIMEMAEQMPAGKTISTTCPSSFWYLKPYPIEAISQMVDYIVMMTYDLHGQWDYQKPHGTDGCPAGSCLRSHVNLTETISALSMITKAGVPSNKVALGVANYARSFQMAEADCYGPQCTFTGPESGAVPGCCTNTAGYISNEELLAIAADTDVYSYIDTDSNSNIIVWDDTQWAGFMDQDITDTRISLYGGMNFLGIANWAIDLGNGNLGTLNGTTSTAGCEVTMDDSVWDDDAPVITAAPSCTLLWPPKPLPTNTTIVFPPWPMQIEWRSDSTFTTTLYGGALKTGGSYHTYNIPTMVSIPPLNINAIPVWYQLPSSGQTDLYQTSSVKQTPFPVVVVPTVGGVTQVTGGTTSTVPAMSYSSGYYTFSTPSWVGVFGGTTRVTGGTTLPATTTTVTPHPCPTKVSSSPDPELNTRTTSVKSATSSGSSKGKSGSTCVPSLLKSCGDHDKVDCFPFCHRGCPFCPPDGSDTNGGGGGDDGGDGDPKTRTGTETSTGTSDSPLATVGGMATLYDVDSFVTTVNAEALQDIATAEAGEMKSLYQSQYDYLTGKSTATKTTTTKPATITSTKDHSFTTTQLDGYVVSCASEFLIEDSTGTQTVCAGSLKTISTLETTIYITTTVYPSATPCSGYQKATVASSSCKKR